MVEFENYFPAFLNIYPLFLFCSFLLKLTLLFNNLNPSMFYHPSHCSTNMLGADVFNLQWAGLLAIISYVVDFLITDTLSNVNVTDANRSLNLHK